MDNREKNRLRLWLRSERALGLTSVPLPAVLSGTAVSSRSSEKPSEAAIVLERKTTPPLAGKVKAPAAAPPPEQPFLSPETPFTTPLLSVEEKIARLAALDDKEVRGCTRCRLCEQRAHTVFGEGDVDAKILFIGEGPGENEDLSGRPFVGRAGQLLEKMIAGMGLKREQVYITNIVKCRPPGNRAPAPDEVTTCTPYLQRQLEIIRPRVIVTLGLPAAQYMLQSKQSMGRLRGQWQSWRSIRLMPTYHPSYVLRSYTEEVRAAVWSDLKQVMAEVGLPVVKRP